MGPESIEDLRRRNRELQARLDEAEDTLRAIRNGEVDAILVNGPDGDAVYTLKGADEGYRLLVEQMAEGAVTLAADGLIIFANHQLARMLGLPLERVIGRRIYDFVAPAGRGILAALVAVADGSKSELELNREAGELVPVYVGANRLHLYGLPCTTLVITDLTEQRRNEEIVGAGKLARSILEQAPAAIFVLDPAGRIIQANQAAERLAGESVLLRTFSSAFRLRSIFEKDLTFEDIRSTVHRNGAIRGIRAIANSDTGRVAPVLVSAGRLTTVDVESLGYVITLHDISDLRQMEEELRNSEERYRTLFNAIDEGFCIFEMIFDVDGLPVDFRYVETNEGFERQTGRRPKRGQTMRELFPEARDMWLKEYAEVARTGIPKRFLDYSEGLDRWYDIYVFPFGAPKEGAQLAALFSDVTEGKRAEQSLRASEARFRLLVDNVQEYALFQTDLAGKVTSWNPGAERLFGYAGSEMLNQDIDRLLTPEDREADVIQKEIRRVLAGLRQQDARWLVRKDGSRFWGQWVAEAVHDETGTIRGVAKVLRDETERKQAEERQLLLIGELNHRVKNTLATVQAMASQTMRSTPDPAEFVMRFFERLQALSTAHDLLTRTTWQGADVADIVREQMVLDRNGAQVSTSGPPAFLDASSSLALALVVHELGTNARKHGALSASGGRVVIKWEIRAAAGTERPRLCLAWSERDGPPVRSPVRRGFGATLVDRSLRGVGGRTDLRFEPHGVQCEIELPLAPGPDALPN